VGLVKGEERLKVLRVNYLSCILSGITGSFSLIWWKQGNVRQIDLSGLS
jgi:hypothetical protein